ncbi:MAG TPA: LCP family protein [Candidatus Limnocylindrales bacterium]|nr:LCP family protein [Candidatus Limnocylindrales bacterium]
MPASSRTTRSPHAYQPPRKSKRKSPRWAKLFVVLGALMMVASGGALVAAKVVFSKVEAAVPQENLLGDAGIQGTTIEGPVNLLLVGLDQREEQNDDSVRADTIMMVHIPTSHDQAYLVSVPRDLRVKIPDYPKSNFKGWSTKINASFQGGYKGPGTEIEKRKRGMELLALTIRNTWGISFDGAAIIDFVGFEAVLKELGGVTMCVDRPAEAIHLAKDKNGKVIVNSEAGPVWYDDTQGKVRGIPPGGSIYKYSVGCQRMTPELALEYSRLRKGTCCPNGDYDRQRHQQQLIKQIVKEATSKGVLTDLGKLNRVMQAAGKAFVLDTRGVSVADYLVTFKDIADQMTQVKTNAGKVNTIEGSSDEALTPDSVEMMAAFKNKTLPTWLLSHMDFIGTDSNGATSASPSPGP